MTEPTTEAGRALLDEMVPKPDEPVDVMGAVRLDYRETFGDRIAAIEAEARQQERERIAAAVKAFIASAEPDIAYEGEGFVDYIVPFDAMDALKAAITGEEQGRG